MNDSGAVMHATGRSVQGTFDLQGAVFKPIGRGFVFETNVGANLMSTSIADLATSATGLVPGTSTITGATSIIATDSRVSTSIFGWHVEPKIRAQRLSLSTRHSPRWWQRVR